MCGHKHFRLQQMHPRIFFSLLETAVSEIFCKVTLTDLQRQIFCVNVQT